MWFRTERRLARLKGSLDELCALLEANGDKSWLGWARRCRQDLGEPSIQVFRNIVGVYGGMGSFNDLVLGSPSGDLSEMNSANAALNRLRARIYNDARLLCFPQRSSHPCRHPRER